MSKDDKPTTIDDLRHDAADAGLTLAAFHKVIEKGRPLTDKDSRAAVEAARQVMRIIETFIKEHCI